MKKYGFLLIFIMGIMGLTGCGTMQFDPPRHELAETAVDNVPVAGEVTFNNNQDSAEPVIIHSYGGTKYQSNYQQVTKTMVDQAYYELERHRVVSEGETKIIGLKVTHLVSKYIAFYWKGTMTFTVSLGNGDEFELTINHGTGAGAAQDLSGSIADGVVALFADERVRAYLAE